MTPQASDHERGRLEAAKHAPEWTLDKNAVRRTDIWRRFDRLVRIIGERDHLIDSEVRRLVSELRSLLSTALPADLKTVPCPQCGVNCRTKTGLDEHLYVVHLIGTIDRDTGRVIQQEEPSG